MKNRKFLVPLTVLAAAFASDESMASIQVPTVTSQTVIATTARTINPNKVTFNKGQDQFSFVLKRMEGGMIMADHASHASHASHSSAWFKAALHVAGFPHSYAGRFRSPV